MVWEWLLHRNCEGTEQLHPSIKTQPSAFSLAEGCFWGLTIIEHPLIALQRCILLCCHTSCRGSATPAEEIPELSAGQAEW